MPTEGLGSDQLDAPRPWARTLRLLWETNPSMVATIVLLTVGTALVPAANVVLIGQAVGSVATAVDDSTDATVRAAMTAGAALAGVALFSHVVGVLLRYVESLLRLQMANRLNLDLMEKAARLQLRDYENASTYDRLQLASKEAAFRPYQLFSDLVAALTSSISLVAVAVVLFTWDPVVALAMLAAPIPSVIATMRYGRREWAVENDRAELRRRGQYLQYLVTNDRSFKEIRLLGLAPLLIGRFRRMAESFYVVDRALERGQSLSAGLLGLIGVLAAGAAVLLGVQDSIAIGDVGRLAGYIAAVSAVQSAAQVLFSQLGQLYEHTLFLGNLFGFMDIPEEPQVDGTRPFPRPLRTGIELRGVTFRYPGRSQDALRDVDLFIPAGRSLALVGQNGAGKTTLVKLLTRLYEPTSGQILVDGRPLEEYDVDDLRRATGVLFQDFLQYEATFRENVGFGALEHLDDDARLDAAVDGAGAGAIMHGLPSGADSQLGRWFAGGQQLSVGQWQRVALARAMFRRPALLVLDEPTASIDAQAEADIFERLAAAATATTTLLIAHRFSTVRTADVIVVLEEGRVCETGTHDSLMAEEGRYAHMFTLQARGYAASTSGPTPTPEP